MEIGSALLVRQIVRRILHASEPLFGPMDYSARDLVKMVLGGDRELHREKRSASPFHHLYFSYRVLLDEMHEDFILERLGWSPLPFPGPWSFSLVGLARKKSVTSTGAEAPPEPERLIGDKRVRQRQLVRGSDARFGV